MNPWNLGNFFAVFCQVAIASDTKKNKNSKNIIVILADDLGWNEVSWNNNRFKTPYMEVD